jgi:hypothetical protein
LDLDVCGFVVRSLKVIIPSDVDCCLMK